MKRNLIWIPIILLVFNACEDLGTGSQVLGTSGIKGRITDNEGNSIEGVNVYYLSIFDYLPTGTPLIQKFAEPANADSFVFKLYQNFPNPVYNSSFLRFSIPADMTIEFEIVEDFSGKIKYTFSGIHKSGFYQYYLEEIVSRFRLQNGSYFLKLKAYQSGILKYQEVKKMFVISDLGKPGAFSNTNGNYFYDYIKTSFGDTLFYTYSDLLTNTMVIQNPVNMLFKKEGYSPEIITVDLYPDILLNHDIVLEKEEQR